MPQREAWAVPRLDIVCFYADLGRPYRPLIEQMSRSAGEKIPGCRRVMLTPTPQDWMNIFFDDVFPLPVAVTLDNLCFERARASMSWGTVTSFPFLLVDPDIMFLAPPRIEDNADIQLLWRRSKPDQPVNSGVVYSRPGQVGFWTDYGHIAANLPWRLHGWFCDQLAFSLMTGVYNRAGDVIQLGPTRIKLVDALDHCERPGRATEKAWAHHFKGWTKGEEWKQYYKRGPKSGDGKPLAASASSIAGDGVPNSALLQAASASFCSTS